jgi:tRNA pseudouridine38-40 synthase
MRTLKLTLAYDGTDFAGWQFQPGQRTIQQTLQEAVERITGEPAPVVASGRTDAGVHALGQVAAFETDSSLAPEVMQRALNAELPNDIVVLAAAEAPAGFDPIRHAHHKSYRYIVHDGPLPDVFSRRYAWHIYRRLDADRMNRAAQALVGQHDFSSFETSGSERVSTMRTAFELAVTRRPRGRAGDTEKRCQEPNPNMMLESGPGAGIPFLTPFFPGEIRFEITADGFLYNMMRNIVGTLVEVGRGQREESWLGEVLAAKDRRAAGPAAPPQGLFLVSVEYDSA